MGNDKLANTEFLMDSSEHQFIGHAKVIRLRHTSIRTQTRIPVFLPKIKWLHVY